MTNEYWDDSVESLSRSELDALQLHRLRQTVERVARFSFYQQRFARHRINSSTISSLKDLRKLPFTTRQDLRDHYPYGFLCVPKQQLVRLHVSAGGRGQATATLYSRTDLDNWANLMARCMFMTGARAGDTFQNLAGYGLFSGGLGFHYGAERLGLLIIPADAGNSRRQIQLMQDFDTSVMHITPSCALRLQDVLTELGVDPKRELHLRIAYLGAEPHSEETRRKLEAFYGVRAYNSYGLSEMNGPGVAFECTRQLGMHVWEDVFLAEIVDPNTLEPVPDGTVGELVLTTLQREAMPLVRYRTNDLTRFMPGACPCGREHRRIDRIHGRSDDMFIIKGETVFPILVERVLMMIPEVGGNYVIVLERQNHVDSMTVQIELKDRALLEDAGQMQRIGRKIGHDLRVELPVTPRIELVAPRTLPASDGKAARVVDRRRL